MNLKKQAILVELQYFPPIQYLSKFLQYEKVCIEQHENYLKRSYRNRCHIAMANGLQRLSVPLRKGKNEQQSIRGVRISYEENWQKIHWASIISAYNNAPFFEHYEHYFQPFFTNKFEFLFDFNLEILETILKIVGLKEEIDLTNTFEKETSPSILDFRNQINPRQPDGKGDPSFTAAKYSQVFEEKNGFIPNLSILDLIFCTGPQAVDILENSITK